MTAQEIAKTLANGQAPTLVEALRRKAARLDAGCDPVLANLFFRIEAEEAAVSVGFYPK